MRNAIFYLTYNGIYNFTNGIGTQTRLVLRGLEHMRDRLESQYGTLHFHVVCPQPDVWTWGYDPTLLQTQGARVRALGGEIHTLPYKTHPTQELWDVTVWQRLSAAAAQVVQQHSAAYDRCLLICVDQPWLQVPRYMTMSLQERRDRVHTLLVLYNTAFIRNAAAPDATEKAWEQEGLELAEQQDTVSIADVCPSFTAHLQTFFALQHARFAPYTSSILVDDEEFTLLDDRHIVATLQRYGIPLDVDLVVAFGRAAPIKGFEALIPALGNVRKRYHFVLISVPYPDDPYQHTYDDLLATHRIPATRIRAFTRELPRALCQWGRTRMVVVPSRQETFSNIPLEVALWARQRGPVVVTSWVGGFVDQIDDGVNGFFIDITSCQSMAQTIQHVLELPETHHTMIRQQAYQRVVQRYDFRRNFAQTLQWFWDR